MKKMNMEILNVINAVLDYKRFIVSDNRIAPREKFDWFAEIEKYYYSLPLPEEMARNRTGLERILTYANTEMLEKLCNAETEDLGDYFWIP